MAEYPKVENSCGCIFCDLDLSTKVFEDADGTKTDIHQVTAMANDNRRHTKFIPCPVKNNL